MTSTFVLGPDGIFRSPHLSHFPSLIHGFGSRFGAPPVDVTLRQIHSDRIWNAAGLADRQEEGDALVTTQPGQSIAVRTADCVPILLFDPDTPAVAAIHAGWRGTAAFIARKAVEKMQADFGTHPARLHVGIGPCIRECCYEVGPEVAGHFVLQFPEWTAMPTHLDLAAANTRQLLSLGVPADHIDDSGLCTSCSLDRLFSYRREPENPGRLLASISLRA